MLVAVVVLMVTSQTSANANTTISDTSHSYLASLNTIQHSYTAPGETPRGCVYSNPACSGTEKCNVNTNSCETPANGIPNGCDFKNPSCPADYYCSSNECHKIPVVVPTVSPGCNYGNPVCNVCERCNTGTNTCDPISGCPPLPNPTPIPNGCANNNPACPATFTCTDNYCVAPTPTPTPEPTTVVVTPGPCKASGLSCSATGECCDGLSCKAGFCGTPCVQSGYSCAVSPCCSELSCSASQLCVSPPQVCISAGASCASTACCEGLTCDSSNVCRSGCSSDSECAAGKYCKPSTRVCTTLPANTKRAPCYASTVDFPNGYGDVNQDGYVNATGTVACKSDASCTVDDVQLVAHSEVPAYNVVLTENQRALADVDNNGLIETADATAIAWYFNNVLSNFGVCSATPCTTDASCSAGYYCKPSTMKCTVLPAGTKRAPCYAAGVPFPNGYGDVDRSGYINASCPVENKVNCSDAMIILGYEADLFELNAQQLILANVTVPMATADIDDAIDILKYESGMITNFSICNSEYSLCSSDSSCPANEYCKPSTMRCTVLPAGAKRAPCYNPAVDFPNGYGDVNRDGYVNGTSNTVSCAAPCETRDANYIVWYLMGQAPSLTGDRPALADVDNDGEIRNADAITIERYTLGMYSTLGVCPAKSCMSDEDCGTSEKCNAGKCYVTSSVSGKVWNGDVSPFAYAAVGTVVSITNSTPGWSKTAFVGASGAYSFSGLLSGAYAVQVSRAEQKAKGSCGAGWVAVPGNSPVYVDVPATGPVQRDLYALSDFCMMKYEAKKVDSRPTSQADLAPWILISQIDAAATCSALGSGYHLIRDSEWMAVASNVASVAVNWQNNVVGSGCLYGGHMDNNPASALAASTDIDPYSGTGNTANNGFSCPFAGTDSGKEQRRTFTLSNNEVVWDLSGNVWEWTNDIITSSACSDGTMPVPCTGWVEYSDVSNFMSANWTRLPNSSWNYTYGVGRLFSDPDDTIFNKPVHAFLRGGGYAEGTYAGAFALNLYFAPSGPGTKFGFRCAKT